MLVNLGLPHLKRYRPLWGLILKTWLSLQDKRRRNMELEL